MRIRLLIKSQFRHQLFKHSWGRRTCYTMYSLGCDLRDNLSVTTWVSGLKSEKS